MTIQSPDRDAWAANMVALYAALIRDGHPFAQAVYGDGEWMSILGRTEGTNDQGETFDAELGDMLRWTLLQPAGQWCVFWEGGAGADTHRRAKAWIAEHEPRVSWIPFRPIQWASLLGLAAPFFEACRDRRVILVGPEHLAKIPTDLLDPVEHIEVALPDAWRAVEDLAPRIAQEIRWRGDPLVIFCAGQASNILIHRLSLAIDWDDPDGAPTLIDLGSMLDPYVGVYSRRAYREADWRRDIMPRNIPQGPCPGEVRDDT